MALGHNKDFLFLVRQFCDEENLKKTVHMFEQETGCFFDMKYFEGLGISGNWNEAENYLSGFTGVHDNENSYKIYFEIRKQKYFEALERHDVRGALDILTTELKVFASSNEGLYTEMTLLLTMDDFRNHRLFSLYGDMFQARKNLIDQIKLLIGENPQFHNKLEFPQIEKSRLLCLVNQSLERQQVHYAHLQPEPQPSRIMSVAPPPLSANTRLSQPSIPTSNVSSSTANFVNLSNQAVSMEHIKNLAGSSSRGCSTSMDNKVVSHQSNPPIQAVDLTSKSPADLPKTVRRIMNMNTASTSMDFHPVIETLLLVGNSMGNIELWDVKSEVRLFWNAFTIWRRDAISAVSLKDIDRDPCIRVNRVLWSPDGSLFGVALSKNIVQLYAYHAKANSTQIQKLLEFDAHYGSVNDLAFSSQDGHFFVISCGDDKLIQVWDAKTGSKQYTFEGHSDSVYSLCAHVKEDVHFVFSTSRNGEIKAWLFENSGPRIEYIAPRNSRMKMAYTADGQRLFSCGTNQNGESFIVEWNDIEGYITSNYQGLSKTSVGVVQFSISKNHFLAAGDEHVIKVWNVDNVELLTIIEADGGLPASPCICFNKSGSLLAVFADNNKVKILANDVGNQMLQSSSYHSFGSPVLTSNSLRNLDITTAATRVKAEDETVPLRVEGSTNTFRRSTALNSQRRLITLNASNCRSLRLPSEVNTRKICMLTYTSTGNEIVAVAADGIHLLWGWPGTNSNRYGWATTNYAPQLYHPRSGSLMINHLSNDSSQLVSPFFALSKNDSFVFSASGGHLSLLSTPTFKKLGSYLTSPPIATCISFYPLDNNIVAIGMDDSTIFIYNVQRTEVINRLHGHIKRVSGLAFSTRFKILVSAGVDTQIIVWDYSRLLKKNSTWLDFSADWVPSETSETGVQYLRDQRHFLVVHETQLTIYEASNLARVQQWMVGHSCVRISHATLSADNLLVYTVMKNGILLIFNAWDLIPTFEIGPSVYLPRNLSCHVYPLVVAENPQKPNQFAVGLNDGGVVVIEPKECIGRWLALQPVDHGSRNGTIIQ